MRFGVCFTNRGPLATAENMGRLARAAEDLGFDSFFVTDHIVIPTTSTSRYPYSTDGRLDVEAAKHYLEPLALLCYLAGVTKRVRLGTSVLVLPYRNPVLAAKMIATIDYLSGGRVILGVGVGWWEEEFRALGLAYFKERGAVTDEYIRLFRELWMKEDPAFHGRFYQIAGVKFEPKPVQRPGPPIWIGGHTRAAVRRAAALGDGWHPIGLRPTINLFPEELAREVRTLHDLARQAGRDPKAITLTFRAPLRFGSGREGGRPFTGTPAEAIEDVRQYARAGVSHVVFDPAGRTADEGIEVMARFAREVRPGCAGA